jgi:hypothetical protein
MAINRPFSVTTYAFAVPPPLLADRGQSLMIFVVVVVPGRPCSKLVDSTVTATMITKPQTQFQTTSPEADAACAIDVIDDDMNTPVWDPVVCDAVAGFRFSTVVFGIVAV